MQTRAPDPRTARTRAAILDATTEMLAAPGGASVSVAEIAKRAGVSVGSVYVHFENKDELVAQVVHQAWDRHRGVFELARELELPIERVFAFGDALIAFAQAEPAVYRALRVRAFDPPAGARGLTERELLAPYLTALELDLVQAIERGELAEAPVDALMVLLFSLWSGIAEQLVRRDGLDVEGTATAADAVRQLARQVLSAALSPAALAS